MGTILFSALLAMVSAEPEPKLKPAITAIRITPEGDGYLQGSQAGAAFRSFDGKKETPIATKLDHVLAFAFSADGKTFAVAGGSPAEKGIVEIWSWPELKLQGQLEGHSDVVHDVVWLTSKHWATGSADRTLRIWNAEKRESVQTLKGHSGPVFALAVSPDGKLLCSASGDQTIRVWDTEKWKPARSLNNHLGAVHSIAFQPPMKDEPARLASVSEDGTLRVWQPDIGRMIRIVRHPVPVFAVVWNGNGSRIFTAAKDGHVRIIESDSDKLIEDTAMTDGRIMALAVTADGKRILTGDAKGKLVLSKE